MQSALTNYSNFINPANFAFISLLSVNFTEKSALARGLSDAIDEIFVKNGIAFDFLILNTSITDVFDNVKKVDRTSVASNIINDVLIKIQETMCVKLL